MFFTAPLILLLWCFCSVGATQSSSTVTMTLNEFEEIFQAAKLKDAENKANLDAKKRLDQAHESRTKALEESYKELRQQLQDNSYHHLFPTNFEVLRNEAHGLYDPSSHHSGVVDDVAVLTMELVVRIMSQNTRWTAVPLVDTAAVVTNNWTVRHNARVIDHVTDSDILLLLRNHTYMLATNKSGCFEIAFNQFHRVAKPSKTIREIAMSPSLYPLSKFTIRIANDNKGIGGLSLDPPTAVLRVLDADNFTEASAILPMTPNVINLRWLTSKEKELKFRPGSVSDDQKDSDDGNVDVSELESVPQMTVVQDSLHSIGEGGVVYSTHNLLYSTIRGGEISVADSVWEFFVYGSNTRVTSVMGHGLAGWSVEDYNGTSTKLVKCRFASNALESSVSLLVYTDTDGNTYADSGHQPAVTRLPQLECKNVLRQVGHVAVVQEEYSNAEIHEHERSGHISRCDAADVPARIRRQANRPTVLSYKYLNPSYLLGLSIKEHTAIDRGLILESLVDRMHYQAQVMNTHIAHSVLLIVQSSSTSMQYLELFNIPPSSSMFSLVVNSVPAKPIQGRDGSILIPLMVGVDPEAVSEGAALKSSIELTYLSKHNEKLKRNETLCNGTFDMTPPVLKLPTTVLTVHLRLPHDGHDYRFTGELSSQSTTTLAYPLPNSFTYKTGRRVVPDGYEFSQVDDFWPEDEREREAQKGTSSSTNAGGGVKILAPQTGRSYHFHRLLLLEEGPKLQVEYFEKQRPNPSPSKLQQLLNYFGLSSRAKFVDD